MNPFLIALTLLFSFSAFGQTSSRFRNAILQNSTEHTERISRTCNARADRLVNDPNNLALGYFHLVYRGKFLNDCLQSHKMTIMRTHTQLLQGRINKLRERRDPSLVRDINGLRAGLSEYQVRHRTEASLYKSSCYDRRGLDETSVDMVKQIKKLLMEYYEMKLEMEDEGTL